MQILIYEVDLQILIYFIIYPHLHSYLNIEDKHKFLLFFHVQQNTNPNLYSGERNLIGI